MQLGALPSACIEGAWCDQDVLWVRAGAHNHTDCAVSEHKTGRLGQPALSGSLSPLG